MTISAMKLTLKETVERYAMPLVYKFEDLFFKSFLDRNQEGKCRYPGCASKAKEGKVYCKKHIHS